MSVAMQPVGAFEASVLARAAEARRRLMGTPVQEPPRPKPPEDEPVSRSKLPHAKIIRRKPEKRATPPANTARYRSQFWTAERTEILVAMWAKGETASTIAEVLGGGITRSAICGKIWRIEHPDGKRKPRTVSKRTNVHKKANTSTRSNVVKNASPAPKAAKPVVVALPVHGVSDGDLVKGWLAQNGGPRQFKRGDSGDNLALKHWLQARGYEVLFTQKSGMSVRRAGSTHKPQRMNRQQYVAFVDSVRIAEGLEAIAR